MIFSTVRLANFRNFNSEVMVRTNVPLADGVLLPTYTGNMTAVDPFNDGVDRPISWQVFGPLYRSGFVRNMTVTFRAKVAPGVTDGVGARATAYPNLNYRYFGGSFSEPGRMREIQITDDANNGEDFSFNDSTGWNSLNASLLDIRTDIHVVDHEAPFTKVHMAMSQNIFGGFFAQKFDPGTTNLINGVVTYQQPTSVIEEGPQHRLTRTRCRAYPEQFSSVPNIKERINSFYCDNLILWGKDHRWATLYYHLGSSWTQKGFARTSGGRCFHWRNKLDDDEEASVFVTIKGPRVTSMWGTAFLPEQITRTQDPNTGLWTNIIKLRWRDDPNWVYQNAKEFPYNSAAVFECKLFFDWDESTNPLSVSEEDTRKCMEEDAAGTGAFADTGESWITPIAADWQEKEEAYGPHGALLGRPGTNNVPPTTQITDDDSAMEGALRLMYDTWAAEQDRWFGHEGRFGWSASSGDPGDYTNFFHKHWPQATMGAPDLRTVLDSLYTQANRPIWHYYENATIFRPREHRQELDSIYASRPVPSGFHERVSDVIIRGSNPHREGEDWLGKDLNAIATGTGPNRPNPIYAAGTSQSNRGKRWAGPDPQHYEHDDYIYGTILTANPWLMYVAVPMHAAIFQAYFENVDRVTLSRANQGSGGVPSLWFYGAPRQEARNMGSKTGLCWVINDEDDRNALIDQMTNRINDLYLKPSPASNHDPNSNNDLGWFVDRQLVTHATDAPGSSETNACFGGVKIPGYRPWQACLIWKTAAYVNIVKNTDAYSLDRNSAAQQLKLLLMKAAAALAAYGYRKNGESGGLYQQFDHIDWNWSSNQPNGRGLPGGSFQQRNHPSKLVGCRTNVSQTNPVRNRPYGVFGRDWNFRWAVGLLVVGYEYAREFGELQAQEDIKEILEGVGGYFQQANSRRQATANRFYGWPTQKDSRAGWSNENPWECVMVTPDAARIRSPAGTTNIPAATVLGELTGPTDPTWIGGLLETTVEANLQALGTLSVSGALPTPGGVFELPVTSIGGALTTVFTDPAPGGPVGFVFKLDAATVQGSLFLSEDESPLTVGIIAAFIELPQTSVNIAHRITRSIFAVYDQLDTRRFIGLLGQLSYTHYFKVSSLATKNQTFETPEGDDFALDITLTGELEEFRLDEASYIGWIVRRNGVLGETIISKTLSDGVLVDGYNHLTVSVDGIDTTNYAGKHHHELVVETQGRRFTVLTGSMTVEATSI